MIEIHQIFKEAVIEVIAAGKITRHPVNQRKSPLERFKRELGPFDLDKALLNPIHVVVNSVRDGTFYAIEGATRVEACCDSKNFGPDTELVCKVYGNGVKLPGAVLDELFLAFNSDKIDVSSGIQLARSVGAERPDALYAMRQRERLGKKFRADVGVWKMVQRNGRTNVKQAVDTVLDIWGPGQHTPMSVFKAIAWVLRQDGGPRRLSKRKVALKKNSPDNWYIVAQNVRLNQTGKRASMQVYIVHKLLGYRGHPEGTSGLQKRINTS